MGCGTAVLAILASMCGADPLLAIDVDEWAYRNALENVRLNGIENIDVLHGDARLLGSQTFDVIFANINRNILLQDIPAYAKVLNRGGKLLLSGFYVKIFLQSEKNVKSRGCFTTISRKWTLGCVVCENRFSTVWFPLNKL
jgi:ribosomal protein L11 methyltransferase